MLMFSKSLFQSLLCNAEINSENFVQIISNVYIIQISFASTYSQIFQVVFNS